MNIVRILALCLILAGSFAAHAADVTNPTLQPQACTVVSAATVDLTVGNTCPVGSTVTITGTTGPITSFGSGAPPGAWYNVVFASTPTVNNGASLNLPRATNISMVANYSMQCSVPTTAGTWFCNLPGFSSNVFVNGSGTIITSGALEFGNFLSTSVGHLMMSATAPTSASAQSGGFGSTATVTGNGSAVFLIAATGTGQTSALTITLPTANAGWACDAVDVTTGTLRIDQTGLSSTAPSFTSSVILTGIATAINANDNILFKCLAY